MAQERPGAVQSWSFKGDFLVLRVSPLFFRFGRFQREMGYAAALNACRSRRCRYRIIR